MKFLHQAIDSVNGWLVARRPQAPVASAPADLSALARLEPGALHTPSTPAKLVFTPNAGKTDRFAFPSPAPSGDARNDIVHGERWRAVDQPSNAAVIMLHGGFAPAFTAEKLFARHFLDAGIDVLALALPWHMARMPVGADYSGQYLLSGDIPRLIRGFAQGAQDAAALAILLYAAGYQRVFAGGISLGGNIAAQVAALTELDGIYLLIPAADPYVTLWTTPIGAGVVRAARAAGFEDETVAAAMRLITPRFLGPPRTAPARMRIVLGAHDLLCPPDPIYDLAEAWNIVGITRVATGHRTFGLRLFAVRKMLARAMNELTPIRATAA